MSNHNNYEFAPYFREGLLFLPAKTVQLLIEAGLGVNIAQAALNGLALDDDRATIGEISRAMESMLAQMEEDSQAFQTLSSGDTQFMLTGRTARA